MDGFLDFWTSIFIQAIVKRRGDSKRQREQPKTKKKERGGREGEKKQTDTKPHTQHHKKHIMSNTKDRPLSPTIPLLTVPLSPSSSSSSSTPPLFNRRSCLVDLLLRDVGVGRRVLFKFDGEREGGMDSETFFGASERDEKRVTSLHYFVEHRLGELAILAIERGGFD